MENRYAAAERRKKAVDLIWIHSAPDRWEEAVSLLREEPLPLAMWKVIIILGGVTFGVTRDWVHTAVKKRASAYI